MNKPSDPPSGLPPQCGGHSSKVLKQVLKSVNLLSLLSRPPLRKSWVQGAARFILNQSCSKQITMYVWGAIRFARAKVD